MSKSVTLMPQTDAVPVVTPARSSKAGRKALTLGVLVGNLCDPVQAEILRGIEAGLQTCGGLAIYGVGTRGLLDFVRCSETDALLVLDENLPRQMLISVSQVLPMLVVGRTLPELPAHSLNLDQEQVGAVATQHLLGLGHTKIALLVDTHSRALQRAEGHLKVMQDAGLAVDPRLQVDAVSGMVALHTLLSRHVPFTAVLATTDRLAWQAHVALHRLGWQVPEKISLMGMDDVEGGCHMTPSLSTLQLPWRKLGQTAAERLCMRLAGQGPAFFPEAPRVVERDSTLMI